MSHHDSSKPISGECKAMSGNVRRFVLRPQYGRNRGKGRSNLAVAQQPSSSATAGPR